MRNLFLFFIAIALLSISSCKKNPCSDKLCLNGGVCNDGTCDCAPGYTGSDCSQQKTPISMTITAIGMTAYPHSQSNGNDWDLGSCCPDVYLTINAGTSANFSGWQSTTYINDASAGEIDFSDGLPFTISSPTQDWSIACWDYDGFGNASDDFMGGITFVPSYEDTKWPTYITVTSGNFTFLVFVEWTY